jgi:hypothetical protein
VYHNFPTICAQQFRGPGHEVADLRRVLEMYKRWQDRIFPSAEFDHFLVDVEKLSGSNVLKHELQDMRMSLLKAAQDAAAPAPPQAEGDSVAEAGGLGAAALEMEGELGPMRWRAFRCLVLPSGCYRRVPCSSSGCLWWAAAVRCRRCLRCPMTPRCR